MVQKELELIIFKKIASKLAIPICIFDTHIYLIYCNKKAEKQFNFPFFNSEGLPSKIWLPILNLHDKKGRIATVEKLPFFITSTQYHISKDTFYIKNKNNKNNPKKTQIQISTLPIINHLNNYLGMLAFFQEMES